MSLQAATQMSEAKEINKQKEHCGREKLKYFKITTYTYARTHTQRLDRTNNKLNIYLLLIFFH